MDNQFPHSPNNKSVNIPNSPPTQFSSNIEALRKSRAPVNSSGPTDLLADISQSLRILEDRYYVLRKKTQLTEKTLIDSQREFEKERKLMLDELVSAKLKIKELEEKLDDMNAEFNNLAKLTDVKVLEKYLDFWEPIQFVTRNEVEKLLRK